MPVTNAPVIKTPNYTAILNPVTSESDVGFAYLLSLQSADELAVDFSLFLPDENVVAITQHPHHHWAKSLFLHPYLALGGTFEFAQRLKQPFLVGCYPLEDWAFPQELPELSDMYFEATGVLSQFQSKDRVYFHVGSTDALATRYELSALLSLLDQLGDYYGATLSPAFCPLLSEVFPLPLPQAIECLAHDTSTTQLEKESLLALMNGAPFSHLMMNLSAA